MTAILGAAAAFLLVERVTHTSATSLHGGPNVDAERDLRLVTSRRLFIEVPKKVFRQEE